jgi:transcription-repair coupling factor (superfamily II helicase)
MTGILQKLKKLIPNARIAYAHGKLHRDELEDVLTNFIEHEYDVLISTTIIETGIDIPNTNTLIIHDADKLGLSQLYQIRGRVGRSDRIAYAYLFYEQYLTINDEARKRLQAIQDFTALGSGYKIALRDLAIRGAGDILGQEQSGFIDTVGYELYMKLVEEAMTGKKAFDDLDPKDNEAYAARHVDPQYANYDTLRIEIHKRIATLHTLEDVETLKEELTDRFGPIDGELRQYMYEKLFKKLSHKLKVIQVSQTPSFIKFTFHKDVGDIYNKQPFMQTVKKFSAPSSLDFERGHIVLKMEHYQRNEHWLYLACQLFETLIPYQIAVL